MILEGVLIFHTGSTVPSCGREAWLALFPPSWRATEEMLMGQEGGGGGRKEEEEEEGVCCRSARGRQRSAST